MTGLSLAGTEHTASCSSDSTLDLTGSVHSGRVGLVLFNFISHQI